MIDLPPLPRSSHALLRRRLGNSRDASVADNPRGVPARRSAPADSGEDYALPKNETESSR